MEKILKFKGKFNINPRISTLNNNINNYYSEQSANEEETDQHAKARGPKHKSSKYVEEEGEEEKQKSQEKHHSNTVLLPKLTQKTYETDNSEPNTPNDNGAKGGNVKKSKFKSLTNNETTSHQEINELAEQFEVKMFSSFETKTGHFSNAPEASTVQTNNGMEIELEVQKPEPQPIETQVQENHPMAIEQDVFKQQEEKLFKRNELKINTMNLINQFQQEFIEINSEAKIPKKKSKEGDSIQHEFRHLIFSPHCSELVFKRHLTIIYRGLIYAKKCLKGPSENYLKSKQMDLVSRIPNLAPMSKTLVLDLDETLIHSCSLKENPMHVLKTIGELGEETPIGLNVRPFCLDFLQDLSKLYEIYVFTASSFSYANAVLKFLDPYCQYISGLLSRSNCMQTKNGFFIKDLRIIRNKNLKDVLIVDNLAHSFGFQIGNGIPILEWHSGEDSELYYLKQYLMEAARQEDVREFNLKHLKLEELAAREPEELGI